MSAAWTIYHRRAAALRDVLERLDANGGRDLPYDAVSHVFTDRDDLLVALHDLWTRRVSARVEQVLELDPLCPEQSVAGAWRAVAAEHPAVRRVLDRHADDPALAASERSEHRLLALAAGRAAVGDPPAVSAAAGAAYVASFRRGAESSDRHRREARAWWGRRSSTVGAA